MRTFRVVDEYDKLTTENFARRFLDLIAATAMVEGIALVTADMRIRRSKVVETVW